MSIYFSSQARQHFPELVNKAAYGKKIAALIPIEDLETIEAIEDRIDLEE